MYLSDFQIKWRKTGANTKVSNIKKIIARNFHQEKFSFLEIGCGDGAIAEELSQQKMLEDYLGIDISKTGIEVAKSKKIPKCQFVVADSFGELNLKRKFDFTLLCHVLEHVTSPRSFLQEAAQTCDWLVIEVPLEDNMRLSLDYDWDPVGHINKFNKKSLRHLIQTSGLEIVDSLTTNPSRKSQTFHSNSLMNNCKWFLRVLILKLNQNLARQIFTCHETLLVRKMHSRN